MSSFPQPWQAISLFVVILTLNLVFFATGMWMGWKVGGEGCWVEDTQQETSEKKEQWGKLEEEETTVPEQFLFFDTLTRGEIPIPREIEGQARDSQKDVSSEAATESIVPGTDGEKEQTARMVPGEGYLVRVASFRSSGLAEKLAEGLRHRGYNSDIVPVAIPGKGRFWRVQIGPFHEKEHAIKIRKELEGFRNLAPLVVVE